MRVAAFFGAVAVCFAVANAQAPVPSHPPPNYAPGGTPYPTMAPPTMRYFSMPGMPQPEPKTYTETSAIKFQPMLSAPDGSCDPYPAVTDIGQTALGLYEGVKCVNKTERPRLGSSQVYGRSEWFNEYWAMMFAWFFPISEGANWKCVVVWINNPSSSVEQTVRYISTQESPGVYSIKQPSEVEFKDTHVQVTYADNKVVTTLKTSGQLQPLIMWHQLTDKARLALNDMKSFGGVEVPINDKFFRSELDKAYPAK